MQTSKFSSVPTLKYEEIRVLYNFVTTEENIMKMSILCKTPTDIENETS
jgi:hypothetical protein